MKVPEYCDDCASVELEWHVFSSSYIVQDIYGVFEEDVHDSIYPYKSAALVCQHCGKILAEMDAEEYYDTIEAWRERDNVKVD